MKISGFADPEALYIPASFYIVGRWYVCFWRESSHQSSLAVSHGNYDEVWSEKAYPTGEIVA